MYIKFKPDWKELLREEIFFLLLMITLVIVACIQFFFEKNDTTGTIILESLWYLLKVVLTIVFILSTVRILFRLAYIEISPQNLKVFKGIRYIIKKPKILQIDKIIKIELMSEIQRDKTFNDVLYVRVKGKSKFIPETTRFNVDYFQNKYQLLKKFSEVINCEKTKYGKKVGSLTETVTK